MERVPYPFPFSRFCPPGPVLLEGQILFEGEDLLKKNPKEMTRIRGKKIAMILQDTMLSLDPVFTVGAQIRETLCARTPNCGVILSKSESKIFFSRYGYRTPFGA